MAPLTRKHLVLLLVALAPVVGFQNYGSGIPMVNVQPAAAGSFTPTNFTEDTSCEYVAFFTDSNYANGTTSLAKDDGTDCTHDTYTWDEYGTADDIGSLPTGTPGAGYYALELDGNNDFYELDSSLASGFGTTGTRSVFCWVYPRSVTSYMRWMRYEGSGANDSFRLSNAGVPQFYPSAQAIDTALTINTWNHIGMTASADPGDIVVYLNGEEACDGGCQTGTADTHDINHTDIRHGSNANGWDGYLFECSYFTKEFSAEEACELCSFGVDAEASRNSTCGSCDYTP